MSSSIPLGAPNTSWQYKDQAKAIEFNMLLRDIIPAGIYSGGQLAVFNTTTVTIPIHSAIIHTNGILGAVKYTNTIDYNFPLWASTPLADGEYIIYAEFTWAESPNSYPGFYVRAIGSGAVTNELIFGTAIVVASIVTSVTPNRRMIGTFNNIQMVLDRLMITQGWTYSETVGAGTTDYPQYLVLSNGVNRIRLALTYTSTTAQTFNPLVIVYQYSWDSGTTYVTIATETNTYTTDRLTGTTWT